MSEVTRNVQRVKDRIRVAAERSRRDPASIRLIAVTKSVDPDHIREAIECGISEIGENRLQEALTKREALKELPLTWHFIGHLQTNKAKKVVEAFQWVQSVDRLDLAEKLNQAAPSRLPVLPVLIEVKLEAEVTKSGVGESQVPELVKAVRSLPHLDLRGFMAVPPYLEDAEATRPYFRRLRELAQREGLPELSMGMSHDFEVAIEEGATMIRVGTALFGERQYP